MSSQLSKSYYALTPVKHNSIVEFVGTQLQPSVTSDENFWRWWMYYALNWNNGNSVIHSKMKEGTG